MKRLLAWLGLAALVPLCAPGARAQGDECFNGTPISGVGAWAFDTTAATDSNFAGGGGCAPGAANIVDDVFWVWTAPASGAYTLTTSHANFPTRLSAHLGTHCGATCVAHGGRFGTQSSYLSLPAVQAGDAFLIQVGGGALVTPTNGNGVLHIALDPCPTASDDALEDNDTCAAALPLTPGVYPGLFASAADPDYFAVTLQDGERCDARLASGGLGRLMLTARDSACVALPSAPLGGLLQTEPSLSFTNTSGATLELVLEVRVDPDGPPCVTPYELRLEVGPAVCDGLFEDGLEPNDDCTTARALCDGFYPTLLVDVADEDYYALTVAPGGSLTLDATFFTFGGLFGNVELLLYDALEPCASDQGGPHGCANAIDCATGAQGQASVSAVNNGAEARVYLLEVRWLPALMSCGYYELDVAGTACSSAAFAPFCADAAAHCGTNTGLHPSGPARIGGGFFDDEELHLEVLDGPDGEFGYLLVAALTAEPGAQVADGRLCLLNPIGRYSPGSAGALNSLGRFDASGRLENLAGTSRTGTGFDVPLTLPAPPGGALLAGSTWSFQCWYRCGASSNFSDGVTVTFP